MQPCCGKRLQSDPVRRWVTLPCQSWQSACKPDLSTISRVAHTRSIQRGDPWEVDNMLLLESHCDRHWSNSATDISERITVLVKKRMCMHRCNHVAERDSRVTLWEGGWPCHVNPDNPHVSLIYPPSVGLPTQEAFSAATPGRWIACSFLSLTVTDIGQTARQTLANASPSW